MNTKTFSKRKLSQRNVEGHSIKEFAILVRNSRSVKKMFLKMSQNSQGNITGQPLLIKVSFHIPKQFEVCIKDRYPI